MSTPYPPDPAQGPGRSGSTDSSGPVRYPTGQPSFPYPGSNSPTQPSFGQPYAPPPPSQPAYTPPPAPPSYPPPAASYVPPSQPYQQAQPYPSAYAQAAPPPSVRGAKPNYVGLIIALAGNLAVVIAFFALPLVSVGIFGSYTAVQVFNESNRAYSLCSSFGASGVSSASCPSFNYGLLLWLPAVLGGASVLIAGITWLASASSGASASRASSIVAMLASIAGVLALGVLLFGTSIIGHTSLSLLLSYVGIGFWLMVIGFLAGVAGAIVQLSAGN